MTDLHTRLLAAVQQRMDVARAAASTSRPSPQMVGAYAEWYAEPYYTLEDEPYSVVVQPPLGQILPASMETRIAEHIAANDPATVLRHCEHDLALLAEIASWEHEAVGDPYFSCSATDLPARPCDCGLDERRERMLTALAVAYGIEVAD